MDLVTLRRLLIDRELGELNADTAALLDAFLATGGSSGAAETDTTATIRQLRAALAAPPSARPSPLPSLRIATPSIWRLTGVQRLATAAAIVLAFFAGTRSVTVPSPNWEAKESVVMASSESAAGGFWALDRLRHMPSSVAAQPRILNWTSPVSLPQPGEGS